MQFEVTYQGERLLIERNPPTKRMKRLRINVHQDTRITISAPKQTSQRTIERFIDSHKHWIYQQYTRAKAHYQPPPQYRYEQGELHWFKGQLYPLHIDSSQLPINTQHSAPITLSVKHPDTSAHVKRALQHWYKQQALRHFNDRVAQLIALTPWVKQAPLIKIRRMKRQWGNCAQAGHITLNTQLIKAPILCMDYVILHELCHLQEFNHSPKFYALMRQVMPDWQTHKAQLNQLTSQLIY